MNKKITGLVLCAVAVLSLASCKSASVLKTKEVTNKLKQTSVILENGIPQCEEYEYFNTKFKKDFTVPGLFEGFIPQGICVDADKDNVIISGYFENGEYPSMLTVTDKKTGKLIKYVSLCDCDGKDFFGHAGGVAYSDGYFYVTTGFEAFIISAKTLYGAENGDTVSFESNFKLNTKGSFCNISNGIFWTGTFTENSEEEHKNAKVTTLSNGESLYSYCEGYKLEDGLPNVNNLNPEKNGYIPDFYIAVPDEVQGITVTPTGTFIFSTSYGRKSNSKLIFYDDILSGKKISAEKIDGYDIDLIACSGDKIKKEIELPPMSQGIDYKNGILYVLFESGASKYRSHGGKYPADSVYTFKFD